jgi:DNA repair protein RecO (recombination protein O)
MATIHSSEAYLIKQIDLPDVDRLGVFYTKNYGKQTLLLKGIKKPTSKLQYRLYDWGKSEIEFIIGRNTARLIAIKDIDSYSDLYLDLKSTALMGIIFELLDQLTDENHSDINVFECIEQYVDLVKKHSIQYQILIGWLLMRLLYTLGYGINLSHCVVTGATKSKDFGISIRAGGLVVSELKSEFEDYMSINSDLIYVLRQWQKGVWIEVKEFPWNLVQHQLHWYGLKSNSLNII